MTQSRSQGCLLLVVLALEALLLPTTVTGLRIPHLFAANQLEDSLAAQRVPRRKLAEEPKWESGAQCLASRPAANVCNPYAGGGSKVYAIQHRHLPLVNHLSAVYNGSIPRASLSAQALRMPLVSTPIDYDWRVMFNYTQDHAPQEDGYLHVLVEDVPCLTHGCCSLQYRLRPNSTDLISFRNFMVFSEYKFLLDLQHLQPEFILDVGGVGMSAVWLALLFPHATVVRLEPHPSNYLAGVVNSLNLKNVWQINLGLWDKAVALQACERLTPPEPWFIGLPSFKQLGFFCREPQDPPCDVVSVDRLNVAVLENIMSLYSIPKFDIVKMDIEGAEDKVFSTAGIKGVLRNVMVFMAELHERHVPGSAARVHNTFTELGVFKHWHDDENDIWVRDSLFDRDCLEGGSVSTAL